MRVAQRWRCKPDTAEIEDTVMVGGQSQMNTLTVKNGEIRYNDEDISIRSGLDGVQVGCTYVSKEALTAIWEEWKGK